MLERLCSLCAVSQLQPTLRMAPCYCVQDPSRCVCLCVRVCAYACLCYFSLEIKFYFYFDNFKTNTNHTYKQTTTPTNKQPNLQKNNQRHKQRAKDTTNNPNRLQLEDLQQQGVRYFVVAVSEPGLRVRLPTHAHVHHPN